MDLSVEGYDGFMEVVKRYVRNLGLSPWETLTWAWLSSKRLVQHLYS